MDYKMNINYLKKDMLMHELSCRGIPVDDTKTVEDMRSALRPLLSLEKKNKPLTYPSYNLSVTEEFTQIHKILSDVKSAISNLLDGNATQKFQSAQSRLVHLLRRTDRIPILNISAEQAQERSSLLADILATLDTLETTSKEEPNLSHLFQDIRLEEEPLSESDESIEHISPNNSTRVPTIRATNRMNYSRNIDKWNLKFTGDNKCLSVHNFLERVDELRRARNVTESELFDSAIDLFTGKALLWYRSNVTRFADWTSLSKLLRQHFEPPDYRPRLFKEILERTQDVSEGIIDYLSCMNALFRRYGGLPETTQLDIIVRNLSPFYSTQLSVVNTIEELEQECLKLEVKKYRAETYVPPSRKRQQFVEPDFAYVSLDVAAQTSNVSDLSNDVAELCSTPMNIVCWNCRKPGHVNRNCTSPRKTHCFRCGTPDVTIRSCPKCSSSGNDLRERQ